MTCQFCDLEETSNHLFFSRCFYAQQIWQWMGDCFHYYQNWRSIADVIHFVMSLPKMKRTALLIVACAVIWSIWKHRNDLCFNNNRIYSARSVILQILSLVSYWTGTAKEELQVAIQEWVPLELDEIPLQVLVPSDVQMVDWVTADGNED